MSTIRNSIKCSNINTHRKSINKPSPYFGLQAWSIANHLSLFPLNPVLGLLFTGFHIILFLNLFPHFIKAHLLIIELGFLKNYSYIWEISILPFHLIDSLARYEKLTIFLFKVFDNMDPWSSSIWCFYWDV